MTNTHTHSLSSNYEIKSVQFSSIPLKHTQPTCICSCLSSSLLTASSFFTLPHILNMVTEWSDLCLRRITPLVCSKPCPGSSPRPGLSLVSTVALGDLAHTHLSCPSPIRVLHARLTGCENSLQDSPQPPFLHYHPFILSSGELHHPSQPSSNMTSSLRPS